MKLYAAMLAGIAIGAGIALVLAARELEDTVPPATTTMPVTPAQTTAVPPTAMGA